MNASNFHITNITELADLAVSHLINMAVMFSLATFAVVMLILALNTYDLKPTTRRLIRFFGAITIYLTTFGLWLKLSPL
jgi:hypothetical protein